MKGFAHHWKEGRHYDLWSITHTLSGVVLASTLFYFNTDLTLSFVVASMLFVGWEAVEVTLGIKEHISNMVMDVVFDFLGFLAVLYFYLGRDMSISLSVVICSIVAFLIFNTWGFLAHRKRVRNGESHLQ